jgi:hypothetical protein
MEHNTGVHLFLLEKIGVDEENIKINLREMGLEDVDWINLAQERDRWRAVVNMVMNFGVS